MRHLTSAGNGNVDKRIVADLKQAILSSRLLSSGCGGGGRGAAVALQVVPPLRPAPMAPQAELAAAAALRRAHPLYATVTLALLTEVVNSRLFTTVEHPPPPLSSPSSYSCPALYQVGSGLRCPAYRHDWSCAGRWQPLVENQC